MSGFFELVLFISLILGPAALICICGAIATHWLEDNAETNATSPAMTRKWVVLKDGDVYRLQARRWALRSMFWSDGMWSSRPAKAHEFSSIEQAKACIPLGADGAGDIVYAQSNHGALNRLGQWLLSL